MLIGTSPAIREVHRQIRALGPLEATVLIQGETGTGKGLVARLLHHASDRNPFVAVNVAAIPPDLCESELFGHVKGAFTGADRDRPGLVRKAHAGSLLLDEIGMLSPELQAKLLAVLEEGEVRPVGADERHSVDARIIAATNEDLARAVEEGRFREDLYYRLKGFEIYLPPLRERLGDIPELVTHFTGTHPFAGEAMGLLERHPWPGNVRELQKTVRSATLRARGGAVRPEHLPEDIRTLDTAGHEREIRAAGRSIGLWVARSDGLDLRDIVRIVEHEIIKAVVHIRGGAERLPPPSWGSASGRWRGSSRGVRRMKGSALAE